MKRIFLLLAFVSIAAAESTVIRNATVITVTQGTFQGDILVRDGKIAQVGEKIITPLGARVIDAGGQFVMPGIIDAHSHISAEGVNEAGTSVSSMTRIEDVLNAESISIYRALAGGVTTVDIMHGSANAIGGSCAIIKTRWGKDAEGLLFKGARPGLKFALGENPKRLGAPARNEAARRYPATRMGVEDVIRAAFTEAKNYRQSWIDYRAKVSAGANLVPPRRDLKLEPLVEVLEGKRRVHVHAYRSDEILMMIRVADSFGFKITCFEHGLEAYKVAKEIAAHGAAVATFSDWWAYKVEAFDAIPYNAALLTRKGVLTSLKSDDPEMMRRLNVEAAKTIKYGGLTEKEALSLITINPAKELGIEKRVGSIEVGKDADLTIFDKHPLSAYAKVQKVFIDGTLYFDRERDKSERPAKQSRRKALLDKAREEQQKSEKPARSLP